ncbi:MAG: hypothetical protein RMJ48_04980 [Roseiflexaceae bacterium]|nr:hypothetical protein [Roseiflexaceae bacterium]
MTSVPQLAQMTVSVGSDGAQAGMRKCAGIVPLSLRLCASDGHCQGGGHSSLVTYYWHTLVCASDGHRWRGGHSSLVTYHWHTLVCAGDGHRWRGGHSSLVTYHWHSLACAAPLCG